MMNVVSKSIDWGQGLLRSHAGFWTVVSTLVTVATAGSAYLQNYYVQESARQLRVQSLQLETEYRLSQFMIQLNMLVQTSDSDAVLILRSGQSWKNVRDLIGALGRSPVDVGGLGIFSAVPDQFEKRSLGSLYAELVNADPSHRVLYKQRTVYSMLQLLPDERALSQNFSVWLRQFNHVLIGSHHITGLPYMNCPEVQPLCMQEVNFSPRAH